MSVYNVHKVKTLVPLEVVCLGRDLKPGGYSMSTEWSTVTCELCRVHIPRIDFIRIAELVGQNKSDPKNKVKLPSLPMVTKLIRAAKEGCIPSITKLFRINRFAPGPRTALEFRVVSMIQNCFREINRY